VARTGVVPPVDEPTRDRDRADLARRDVGLLVLPTGQRRVTELRTTLDTLIGSGRQIGDAWLWAAPR
jgi:hypothetical protein